MITITIERDHEEKKIVRYLVDGHAEFADPGEDIVCAGVSTITVGTVNAIESLLNIELPATMEKGLLDVQIPIIDKKETSDQTQLLLESMVVMLNSIQESYEDYVNIINNFVKGR
ncbi:ribosomal-processing cysteine protease Prp [Chengkuizengella axinellae]|uniref:Ribosomal processing cysteine protease Prp n=1 Tax=Chengkuizengella axinellae TaxID=3064388 RepID=A0ABT9ITW9_9BACL|nr:ribosomal-processing cysteine protease Prp [Chengkuizengella sp. 2205SS18-9]MDP5272737.1 ribosomal-processing cysteine protease Prp [Chengkuizengella sp. 2205SS18-9]